MTITILRGVMMVMSKNTHQNVITIITNMMMILILMIFTHSRSNSKIKLIMLENNINNLNENLIEQNINYHSQRDDQIHYYNMIT
jgi:hypothetical protein